MRIPLRRLCLLTGALAAALAGAFDVDSAAAGSTLPPLNVAVSTSNAVVSAPGRTNANLPFVQGQTYAVTYIFTDPANAKLTNVEFSDRLPAGLTVAPGTTASALNCGQFSPSPQPGADAITADGFTVYGNSPNHCAMEFFVTASTVEGPSSDQPGSVRFTDNGTPEPSSDVSFPTWSVAVVPPATMAITFPANGARFRFDQPVRAQITASAGSGDSLAPGTLYAVDDIGDEVADGGLIPTDVPGPHTLTVWAQTLDGFIGSGQTVDYRVASPAPLDVRSNARGDLSFKVRYLQTGTVRATARYDGRVVASGQRWVHVGFAMPMRIVPNAAGVRLLARHHGTIPVTLSLRYREWVVHSFLDTPAAVFGGFRLG